MEISVEKTSNLGRSVKVKIPASAYDHKVKEKIKTYNKINLKGYRPGKIPSSVIENRFGAQVRNEVFNEVVSSSFYDAITKENLSPAVQPKFKDFKGSIVNNETLEYTAEFEVFPSIELADFGSISVEREMVQIADSDVHAMIERLKAQYGRWDEVLREAQTDDRLSVNYKRKLLIDGSEEEQEQAQNLVLGSKGILPELNAALVGKKVGDTVTVQINYPESWADLTVAGKSATLEVSINLVESNTKADIDKLLDMFGIEGGEEVLVSQLRERMEAESKQAAFNKMKEVVLEQLIANNSIELPESLVVAEKERLRLEMLRARTRVKNTIPLTQEQEEQLHENATNKVLLGVLLQEIIQKYQLKADQAAVRAEIYKTAVMYPNPTEVVNAYYGNEKLLHSVENTVLLNAAVETIITMADVTEKSVAFADVMAD